MLAATAMLLENSAVNMVDWRAEEVGQVFAVRERLSSTAEPDRRRRPITVRSTS
jgi:hypothetical protein